MIKSSAGPSKSPPKKRQPSKRKAATKAAPKGKAKKVLNLSSGFVEAPNPEDPDLEDVATS